MTRLFIQPELYDGIHENKKDDVDFITRWVQNTGGPVLELAAGTGRLAGRQIYICTKE